MKSAGVVIQPAGNFEDKYGSTNPISKKLVAGFLVSSTN